MENIKLLLPSIPEDYEKISLDGDNFCNREQYKDILKILYVKLERGIDRGKITAKEKKNLLLKILYANNIKDFNFHNRLKRFITEGLDKNYICTDKEYESLKKEFNI